MRKIISLIWAFSLVLTALATGGEDWTYYLAYRDATCSIPVGKEVYALYGGNLLSYGITDSEVRFFTKQNGLSDSQILFAGYSETTKSLVLVYQNGNIDILHTGNGNVDNLPQLKNSSDGTLSINNLSVVGDDAVIATNTGIVVLDVARSEIKGVYNLGENILCATSCFGKYFATTSTQILTSRETDNPSDRNSWKPYMYGMAHNFYPFAGGMYILFPQSGLWWVADGESEARQLDTQVYSTAFVNTSAAVFLSDKTLACYNSSDPLVPSRRWEQDNAWKHLSRSADGTFWAADGLSGLSALTFSSGGTLVPNGVNVGGYGPQYDNCYYLKYDGPRLLLGGGRLDPYDRQHYPAYAAVYENGKWTDFQSEGVSDITGVVFRDVTCVVQDPADGAHHFVSTGGNGVYEYRDYGFVEHYSLRNSPLRSAYGTTNNPRYVRTDGLNIDQAGNLWVLNCGCDTVIWAMKPDGKWKGIYVDALKLAPTVEKTLLDTKGRLWVASRRTVSYHTAGLLCLDYNGTIDVTSDDIATYRTRFTNQDGTAYDLRGVYAMAQDRNGEIWLGTGSGLFVITDPDEWSRNDFRITQIKVPRNDGTNYADYLLNGVAVTAIAVDGGNRKWIGTQDNGIYLVSPDGVELIYHFRAENSPLLSNNIYSIAPDPVTGEVMIGTDKGLCSFRGNATEPETELAKNNIKVYPNPVRPDYNGNLTVSGLTDAADVKIVTTGGHAVAGGTSTGGTYVWDLRDGSGNRVATGVYYIMVSTADGGKGVAGKVVVI